jgi:cell division septal protein FtsQ
MWFKREQKNRRLGRGHVLDVKMRSDQVRATRMRLATAAFALIFGTVFGLYLFWRAGEWTLDKFIYENSEFAIQQIDVQTDGKIPEDQIRRWSGVKPGQNLIALDLAAVKRNLEMVSVINSVSVERMLPRTLRIRVAERKAVAQVDVPCADNKNGLSLSIFQLDGNGCVMQPMDPNLRVVSLAQVDSSLPVLTGLSVFQLQPGHCIVSAEALAALKLIQAFDHSPMVGLADFQRVDVSQPQVVIVTTTQGCEITFGLDNLQQQLARWREIYDFGRRTNKTIAAADLAVGNNIPVRWVGVISAPETHGNFNPVKSRRKNV